MLVRLKINNIILLKQVEINFAKGLTVLTGETGAGKSILLDALGLVLGKRAEGGGKMVRYGEESGQVTAEFDIALLRLLSMTKQLRKKCCKCWVSG